MSEAGPSSSPLRRSPRRPAVSGQAQLVASSPAGKASPRRDATEASTSAVTPTRRATKAQQRAFLLNSPQHSVAKRARKSRGTEQDTSRAEAEETQDASNAPSGHAAHGHTSASGLSREEKRMAVAQEREALQEELRALEDEVGALTSEYRRVQRRKRRHGTRRNDNSTGGEDSSVSDQGEDDPDISLDDIGNYGAMAKAATTDTAELGALAMTDAHETSEIKALEAMLRDMDDKDLANLLTNGGSLPADLLRVLAREEAMPLVLPPARSAGIEGTGSGVQIDTEEERLAQTHSESSVNAEVDRALRARLDRSEELTDALSHFCGLDLTSIDSAPLVRAKENANRLLRRTSMRATLPGNLGQLVVDMEVEEDESTREGPQIVGLDVEVGDPVFAAIGSRQISLFVDKVNLPALLLAIRSLIPLAQLRFRLFAHLAAIFSDLAREHVDQLAARGIDLIGRQKNRKTSSSSKSEHLPSLAVLIDPETMSILTLRNDRGAQLDIVFAIEFNQWGHAGPHVTLAPSVPSHVRLSRKGRGVLETLPERFAHLCAHCPSPFDTCTALIATIEAFFAL